MHQLRSTGKGHSKRRGLENLDRAYQLTRVRVYRFLRLLQLVRLLVVCLWKQNDQLIDRIALVLFTHLLLC